jgi:hypothetical protein
LAIVGRFSKNYEMRAYTALISPAARTGTHAPGVCPQALGRYISLLQRMSILAILLSELTH